MPIDERNYAGGGMDQDSAPEYIAPGDYIEAYNLRSTGTAEKDGGYLTNIESNEIISLTLPDGINKCVAVEKFEDVRKSYALIYNSQGKHLLTEFDYDTSQLNILYTNLDDSGGEDALPLKADVYIKSMRLVDKKYLYFLNGEKEPCGMNLDKLRDGSLGTLTREDFLVIRSQPLDLITAEYVSDSKRSANLLRGKLFQFRSQFEYSDNRPSAYSSISKRRVPIEENTPVIGTDVTKDNGLLLTVDIGNSRVENINIASRYGTLDWFTIKSVSREYVLGITNTAVDLENEIYEAYDPDNNTYQFVFYNDGLYNNIDVLETDLSHDYIPRTSEDLEILNGGILTLANNREGYKRPVVDITFSQVTYDPQVDVTTPDQSEALRVSSWYQYRPDNTSYRLVTMYIYGKARTGDKLTLNIGNLDGKFLISYTLEVKAEHDEDTFAALKDFTKELPSSSVSYKEDTGRCTLVFKTRESHPPNGDRKCLLSYKLELANAGTGVSKSIPAVKSNSSYQAAVAFYDKYGRPFPIFTDNDCVVKTPSMAQIEGQASMIHWELSGTPPEGAVSYQLLLSQNNTHQNTVWTNAVLDEENTNNDYFVFKLNTLEKFNENNSSSVINYDYTEGDRCTFVYQSSEDGPVWFNNPCIDVEVAGFEIKTTTDEETSVVTTDYLLKVRKSTSVTEESISGKNLIIEIYTPKKRVNTEGELNNDVTLFYEIGEKYDIVNGEYTVTSGDITEADVYLKTREISNAVDPNILDQYIVEDFNFSDYYQSNYTSYGRPRNYNDTPEDVQSETTMRYSDVYVPLSNINLLNRFYGERIYGNTPGQTSPSYGAIRKIRQRESMLLCFQDLKTGYIPVNTSIIEDQAGQQNIGISDQLLNNIRYANGDIGIGNAVESFTENNGTFYFVNPYRSEPARAGLDGIRYISGKMSGYFKKTLYLAKKYGKKIISYFDSFNNEWLLSTETAGDIVQQISFSDTNWNNKDSYTPTADQITITTEPTKGTVSYNSATGKATYTPSAGETGADSFTFSFDSNGTTITKRVCINIVSGSVDIFDFSFIDKTDQELNTTVESNTVLITGNDISVPVSITGGEYKINDGGWTSADGMAEPEDEITVRAVSSSSYSTTVSAVLTVSGKSDSFDVTTKDDLTPDPFSFAEKTGVAVSTLTESDSVTITGITAPTAISIDLGEYQINGGSWVSTAGTISNNDTVKVRLTSSMFPGTEITSTLTVGGVSGAFKVRTLAEFESFIASKNLDQYLESAAYENYTGYYIFDNATTVKLGLETVNTYNLQLNDLGQNAGSLGAITVPDTKKIFTALKAGTYDIEFSVEGQFNSNQTSTNSAAITNAYYGLFIKINGIEEQIGTTGTIPGPWTNSGPRPGKEYSYTLNRIVALNAGDYIQIYLKLLMVNAGDGDSRKIQHNTTMVTTNTSLKISG